jgi:hypothetical protein
MCIVAYLNYHALKYENREIDIKEIQNLTNTATVMGGFAGAG